MTGVVIRDVTIYRFSTGIKVEQDAAVRANFFVRDVTILRVNISQMAQAGITVGDDRGLPPAVLLRYSYIDVKIQDSSVVDIFGLVSVGRTAIGLDVRFTTNALLQGLFLDRIGGGADFLGGGGIVVEHCDLAKVTQCAVQRILRPTSDFATEWGPAIVIGTGTSRSVFTRNFVTDVDSAGILIQQGSGSSAPNQDNVVSFNLVQRSGQRASFGAVTIDSANELMVRLRLYGNTVTTTAQLNVTGPGHSVVQFVLNSNSTLRPSDCALFNNIFISNMTALARVVTAGGAYLASQIVLRKNIWKAFNMAGSFFSPVTSSLSVFLTATGSPSEDVEVAPELVSWTAENVANNAAEISSFGMFKPANSTSPSSNPLFTLPFGTFGIDQSTLVDFAGQSLASFVYGVGAYTFPQAITTAGGTTTTTASSTVILTTPTSTATTTTVPSTTTTSTTSTASTTTPATSCPSGTSCLCSGKDCVVSDAAVVVAAANPISVPAGGTLTLLGNLSFSSDAVTVVGSFNSGQSVPLVVRGRAVLAGVLRLVTSVNSRSARGTVTATVLQADGGVMGSFSSVEASSSTSTCGNNVASSTPVYSSSTVSVTLTVTPCPAEGLSTGAIIGIAVGAGVGAIVALVIILIIVKKSGGARDKKKFAELQRKRNSENREPPPSSHGAVICL